MEFETLPKMNLFQELEILFTTSIRFLESLMVPGWRLYQVLIIVGLIAVSYGMHHISGVCVQTWVRNRDGWKTWQLRMIVPIRQRFGLIWFTTLGWAVWGVMQYTTWPSRSYLIELAATLASAWLLIAFVSRFVRNRPVRIIVRWGLWIFATLYYLNVHEAVASFLDDLAFELGDFRISVMTIISALVIVGVLFTIARLLSTSTSTSIRRNDDISPSMKVLAVKAVQIIFYGVAFYMAIKTIGIDLSGLAILTGAIGVGLGFGLQKVISNLVSGVIILLDKSIKPGDVISVGETFGWIQTLGARYASVVTRDGKEYLIPNEDLITNQVVNWSHSNDYVRLDIYFGTAYGDDPHQVRELAIEAATTVDRVLDYPKRPVCHIVGFGDSSVDYILRFWIRDPTGGLTNIRGGVYLALWDAFKANDISIPFPQREVKMLDD